MNLKKCLLTNNDCYRSGKTIQVKGIMVHSTGANNPNLKRYVQPNDGLLGVNNNGNDWNHSGISKCVHAFIGKLSDGTIATYQTLPWNFRGWHAGGSANDSYISFEICEDGLNDSTYFNLVYREAVELTAYLCKMYNLNPALDGVVICHSEGFKRGIASNHGDVEHWFPKFGKSMNNFRSDVIKEMEDEPMDYKQFKEYMEQYRKELQDNDSSKYSEEARKWALEKGLIAGGNNKNFNGMWEDFLTREQLVTVLHRYDKL